MNKQETYLRSNPVLLTREKVNYRGPRKLCTVESAQGAYVYNL